LGLARRAGRVVVGVEALKAAARKGRLAVVVVAEDAAENALARVGGEVRAVERARFGTRDTIGRALGRGAVPIVGVTDRSLARRILEETQRQVP